MRVSEALDLEQMPREKLLSKGEKALRNDELLAIMLGTGVQGKDVRKLSKEISTLLERHGDDISVEKLCEVHGLGRVKASQIVAALELGKRLSKASPRAIVSAKMVYELLYDQRDKKQEHFWVVTLDGGSALINLRTVFMGTLTQSIVHPREVFADAISDRAASIIVVHNHPSGRLYPGDADKQVTQRLAEVGNLVGIALKDHLIISAQGYFSFVDERLL